MKRALSIFPIALVASATLATLAAAQGATSVQSQPKPKTRKVVGDWVVECFAFKGSPDACETYQRVLTTKPKRVALAFSVAWSDVTVNYHARIILPLGVRLSQPATLTLSDGYIANLGWNFCTRIGCTIEWSVDPKVISHFLDSKDSTIAIQPISGPGVKIPLSLAGFKNALLDITPVNKGIRAKPATGTSSTKS